MTTWRRLAEVCGEYLKKGRGVRVVGRLKQDGLEGRTERAARKAAGRCDRRGGQRPLHQCRSAVHSYSGLDLRLRTGRRLFNHGRQGPGPYNFTLFTHQWPTRIAEAAAQKPLIDWIRKGSLSHTDFVTAELPVREAAAATRATENPGAIKTLLRF